MTWPVDDLDITHLDEGSDSPALARPMLARLVTRVKSIIASRGVANGIATLDATGKIPAEQLPNQAQTGGTALWTPTGAYQQIARGQTALMLTSSAMVFRRLRFEFDYDVKGLDETSGDAPMAAVPGSPYAGYDSDLLIYRAALSATAFANYLLYSASRDSRTVSLSVGIQLTTATTITLNHTSSSGLRLYGIHGSLS